MTATYGEQEYLDYPVDPVESADNTSSVIYEVQDKRVSRWQASFEITTGTALAGTISIAVLPFGATDYITLSASFTATTPSIFEFVGKYQKIKFVPDSLTAGTKFTPFLDALEFSG